MFGWGIYINEAICQIGNLRKYGFFVLFLVLLFNIICCNCNITILGISVDMHKMLYGNPVIYLLAAINGIIFVLLICQMFLSKFNMQFLQFVGKNTLHIYCLHGLILPFLKKGYHILVNRIEIVDISVVLQVIIAMIAVLICMLIIGGFQKISGIFGMKRKQ